MLSDPPEHEIVAARPRFTLRTLLTLTLVLALSVGWIADRFVIHELESEIESVKQNEDLMERQFMDRRVIGKPITDFPTLLMLADAVVEPTDKYFQLTLDRIVDPDDGLDCKHCKILWFDLRDSGVEGDPFDFYLLLQDDVIVEIGYGESFQS